MSRREPRVSGTRQNDALIEYEALKKKFLHANKAITKLNSTLSIRIEELNAELSSLYVENLRLRTSEITLTAQLKREREKSRKLLADTEAATLDLVKHLGHLRQSHNIDSSPPTPPTLPSPKARRPAPITHPDGQVGRLSRPPNIPEIHEEDEPAASSSDSDSGHLGLFNSRVRSKPRSPSARASRKARPSPPLHIDINTTTQRKKSSRRQSGTLSLNANKQSLVPRPSGPAFGSPIRKAAALAQEEDGINEEIDVLNEYKMKHSAKTDHRKRQAKLADKELMEDAFSVVDIRSSGGRKRPRVEDEATQNEDGPKHAPRYALQPIDNTVQDQVDLDKKSTKTVTSTSNIAHSHSPTASSPNVPTNVESQAGLAGRERRARKSVNYAEPKLNTKMRKPDPPPGTETTSRKKRSSAAAIMTTTMYKSHDVDMKGIEDDVDIDNKIVPDNPALVDYTPSSSTKKKSRLRLPMDDEDSSDGADADEEYMPAGRAGWVNLEGRKRITIPKHATTAFSPAIDTGTDTRRHSMVV